MTPAALSQNEISHVQALADKGYSCRCLAALFDVCERSIYKALAAPPMPLCIELADPRSVAFKMTWAQRVIWADPIAVPAK